MTRGAPGILLALGGAGLFGCNYQVMKLELGDPASGGDRHVAGGDSQPGDHSADELSWGDPGDPSSGDPTSGDPGWGDPSSGDAGDPWSGGDPSSGDPSSGDAGDPWWGGDPSSGDPSSGDAGDPSSGDPWWGDPSGDAGDSWPGDPSLSGDPGVWCTPSPDCVDDAATNLVSGHATIMETRDLVPLCDGEVVLSHPAAGTIALFAAQTAEELATYYVGGAPGDLELDAEHQIVYATSEGEQGVAQLRVGTGEMRNIAIANAGFDLAAGNDGIVYVTMDGTVGNDIGVIDGCAGDSVTRSPGSVNELAVYDRQGKQLITGRADTSPGGLTRFSVNELDGTVTFDGGTSSNGYCRDLAISPDGDHIAFSCSSGNGSDPYYTIWDYATDDFSQQGEFAIGAYPRCAAFSPDGRHLAAATEDVIKIYDVATHAELAAPALDFADASCSNAEIYRVAYSRGGAVLFVLVRCSSGASTRLFWWKL